ncbi:hypothetical protein P0F65_10500 [Sphingomonas sp. I4]
MSPADILAFTETAGKTERDAFVGSYTFAWHEGPGGGSCVVMSRPI